MSEQNSTNIINSYLNGLDTEIFTNILKTSKNQDSKRIMTGKIIKIETKQIVVDVGLKEEGIIPITEFKEGGKMIDLKVGDKITVYRETSADGHSTTFSRSRALKELAWSNIEHAYNNKQVLDGLITDVVNGGFIVEILAAPAFLPEKQLESVTNQPKALLNQHIKVRIIKLDKRKGTITLSQKHTNASDEASQGDIINAQVSAIETDKAFVQYKDQTFTLQARDYLWEKVEDLTQQLHVGQMLKVKIIHTSDQTTFVSHKLLITDPWLDSIKQAGLDVGSSLHGKVVSVDASESRVKLSSTPPVDAILLSTDLSVDVEHVFVIKEIDKKNTKLIVEIAS